jgi:hypothetical protein
VCDISGGVTRCTLLLLLLLLVDVPLPQELLDMSGSRTIKGM